MPKLSWIAVAVLSVVLAFGVVTSKNALLKERIKTGEAERKVQEKEDEILILQRDAADKGLAVEALNNQLEAKDAQHRQEAERAASEEKSKTAAVVRELTRTRTERDGLRDAIDAYARPTPRSGERPEDQLAACGERASTLGRFIDDGLRVQETLGERAETCASDLRRVLASWPVVGAAP